jgi:anti-anti-sigma factor
VSPRRADKRVVSPEAPSSKSQHASSVAIRVARRNSGFAKSFAGVAVKTWQSVTGTREPRVPNTAEIAVIGNRDGVVVLSVVGEIDLANVDEIRDQILAAAGDDPGSVVLDLGPTRYLDSSGIRMLFEVDEEFTVRRIPFRLVVGETGFVHRVLDLTGVLRHIDCFPNTDTAIAAASPH